MYNVRCLCGKIVCQVDKVAAMPIIRELPPTVEGPAAVIFCRHCKRYVVLQIPAVTGIYATSQVSQAQAEPAMTVSL